MKKPIGSVLLAFVLLTIVLSGCAPASTPVPLTLTFTPIPPTDTPVPTATELSTVTPTSETRQFKECTPKEFLNCRLDLNKDLLSGDYGRWVASNFHVGFDQSAIKTNVFLHEYALVSGSKGFGAPGNMILYNIKTSPNFKNTKTEPFVRGLTTAVTTVTDSQGNTYDEVIIPIFFNNPNDPKHNIVVLTALSFWVGRNLSPQEEADVMNVYMTDMNIPPIGTSYYDSMAITPGTAHTHIDPILKAVFATHDMTSIFQKVTGSNSDKVSNEDISVLGDPTIIVGTDVKGNFIWYK